MTASFEHIKDNKYTMLIDGTYFGVHFLVPEGYTMDDYKDSVEVWDYKEIKRCRNLVIELDNEPSKVKVYIDSRADVACTGDLILKISKSLAIQRNQNLVLSAKDGVNTISFENLGIKENQDTNIEFYPTPRGVNLKDSLAEKDPDLLKRRGTFESNRRINYKLQDNFVAADLMSGKSHSKTPMTLDFTSTFFCRVMNGDFHAREKNQEVKFECGEAFILYSTITLTGEAKDGPTILRNKSSQNEPNRILLNKCSMEFQPSTSIQTKARILSFSAPVESLERNNIFFSGINHINSANIVDVAEGSYKDIDIDCSSDTLSLTGKNKIKSSHISIATLDENKKSIIDNSKITWCHINDLKGDIAGSEIYNCLGKDIKIAKDAKIVCDFNEVNKNKQFIFLNNFVLKEGTNLTISNALEVDNQRVLNNCIVEKGDFRIVDTNPYTISNTVFRDGQLALNFKGEATIQNSIFEGKNDLKDIIGVYSCDLQDVSIRAKESASISNEILKNEQIKDYASFSKEKTVDINNELRVGNMASNDVEIL